MNNMEENDIKNILPSSINVTEIGSYNSFKKFIMDQYKPNPDTLAGKYFIHVPNTLNENTTLNVLAYSSNSGSEEWMKQIEDSISNGLTDDEIIVMPLNNETWEVKEITEKIATAYSIPAENINAAMFSHPAKGGMYEEVVKMQKENSENYQPMVIVDPQGSFSPSDDLISEMINKKTTFVVFTRGDKVGVDQNYQNVDLAPQFENLQNNGIPVIYVQLRRDDGEEILHGENLQILNETGISLQLINGKYVDVNAMLPEGYYATIVDTNGNAVDLKNYFPKSYGFSRLSSLFTSEQKNIELFKPSKSDYGALCGSLNSIIIILNQAYESLSSISDESYYSTTLTPSSSAELAGQYYALAAKELNNVSNLLNEFRTTGIMYKETDAKLDNLVQENIGMDGVKHE